MELKISKELTQTKKKCLTFQTWKNPRCYSNIKLVKNVVTEMDSNAEVTYQDNDIRTNKNRNLF